MSSRERERRRSPRREHRDRERRPRERSVSPPRGGSRHRSPRREPRNRDDECAPPPLSHPSHSPSLPPQNPALAPRTAHEPTAGAS